MRASLIVIAIGLALFGAWFAMNSRKRAARELAEHARMEALLHQADRAVTDGKRDPNHGNDPLARLRGEAHELAKRTEKRDSLALRIRATQNDRRRREESFGHGDEAVGTLDKDYIRGRVSEIAPLLKECYELARDKQPDLSGRLLVEFKISGEPGLGGVVDRAQVMHGASVPDGGMPGSPILDECVQATVESLTFDPPKGGGTVTVHYPFVFAQSGDGGT